MLGPRVARRPFRATLEPERPMQLTGDPGQVDPTVTHSGARMTMSLPGRQPFPSLDLVA
jgi:hypothetical protein